MTLAVGESGAAVPGDLGPCGQEATRGLHLECQSRGASPARHAGGTLTSRGDPPRAGR